MSKPLTPDEISKCIGLLTQAITLAQQANQLLEVAGLAVNGVLNVLQVSEGKENDPNV
jgi:hypothetical protein